MADPNFSWIYIIIFLAIPLARIVPRILAKRGIGKNSSQNDLRANFDETTSVSEMSQIQSSKPQSNSDLVLDALNRGSKTFEIIQKNTGLDSQELDSLLESLENDGFLKVVHKQGLFGTKTELYATDKWFGK